FLSGSVRKLSRDGRLGQGRSHISDSQRGIPKSAVTDRGDYERRFFANPWDKWEGHRKRWYVFSVAAGILPVSLNTSRAGAAGIKRSAPVLGRSNVRQRRESGQS